MNRQVDLSMAEFKGTVLKSLESIEKNIDEMKRHCAGRKSECTGIRGDLFRRVHNLELRPPLSIDPFGWVVSFFRRI